jgi:hypothetical protein
MAGSLDGCFLNILRLELFFPTNILLIIDEFSNHYSVNQFRNYSKKSGRRIKMVLKTVENWNSSTVHFKTANLKSSSSRRSTLWGLKLARYLKKT